MKKLIVLLFLVAILMPQTAEGWFDRPRVRIISPNGDYLSSQTTSVPLSWEPVQGAAYYQVEYACDYCYSTAAKWMHTRRAVVYATNYNLTDLPGHYNQYRFRVRSYDYSNYPGRWSAFSRFYLGGADPDPNPPVSYNTPVIYTPSSYQVLTNYPRTAYLSWSSVSGALDYQVMIECADGCWLSNNQTYNYYNNVSATSYTSEALSGDNTFRYKVRARFSNSYGAFSDYRYFSFRTSSVNTNVAPVIYAPENNSVQSTSLVRVAWYPVTGATKYYISLDRHNGSSYGPYATANTTASEHQLSMIDGLYGIKVRAQFPDGSYGPWSDYRYVTFRSSTTTLSAPTITWPGSYEAVTGSIQSLVAQWTTVYGASYYRVQLDQKCSGCNANGDYSVTQFYNANSASQVFSNLANDMYRIRVKTYDNSGNSSEWSAFRYFTYTNTSSNVLYAPVISSPAYNANLSYYPNIIWNSIAGAGKYEINIDKYCSTCSSNPYEMYIWTDAIYSSSYQMPSNSADGRYRVKVRAKSASNQLGTWSDYSYFNITTAVTSLSTPVISSPLHDVTISYYPNIIWNAVSGAQKYELDIASYCSTCNPAYTTAYSYYNIYSNQYQMPTVPNNNYRVKVRAVSANGQNSNWSDPVYFNVQVGSTYDTNVSPGVYSPINNTNYSFTPAFSWYAVSGASSYDIRLERSWNNGGTYTETDQYSVTGSTIQASSLSSGYYRLRARALFPNGVYGPWSEYKSFNILLPI